MSCLSPANLALTCGVLALLACGENTTPTSPATSSDGALAPSVAAGAGTWTTVAPGSDVSGISVGVAPNSTGQDIVYTFGGFDGDGGALNRIGAYNPATDTWTYRDSPTFETQRFSTNGVAKLGNKLYFSGGYNSSEGSIDTGNKTLWAYDYRANKMIRKADLPIAGAEGVSGVINGKLYVLPGVCAGDRYPEPGYCAQPRTRRFFRYDPATNTWIIRASAPHFHRLGAAGVINGKFYVTGGFDENQLSADLDVYDPATDTWRTLAPLPRPGRGFGAVIHGGLFVAGSDNSYFYNPATNRWSTKAAPKVGHSGLARAAIAGRAYLFAVGGSHLGQFDEQVTNGTEKYTP
jgi:N-acetylneuraminic acid mutarotase